MKCSLLLLVLVIAGCGGLQDTASLGEEFSLHPGEDIAITGEDLTITFVSVTNDSRCPAGVQCVWEGNAEVHIRMAKAGHPESEVVLNTSSRFATEAPYLEYVIRMSALKPLPSPGMTIYKVDYLAELAVTRP